VTTVTNRQKQIVRDTFDTVRGAAIPVMLLFYGRLFERDPSIRSMFHIDIRLQSGKLLAMLDAIIESLDAFDEMRPKLRELGRRHAGYGVREDQYETLTSALLWAFGHALEHQFDPAAKQAWATLLADVCAEMKKGAADASGTTQTAAATD
jgi:hemoglobin-like flavoprotein